MPLQVKKYSMEVPDPANNNNFVSLGLMGTEIPDLIENAKQEAIAEINAEKEETMNTLGSLSQIIENISDLPEIIDNYNTVVVQTQALQDNVNALETQLAETSFQINEEASGAINTTINTAIKEHFQDILNETLSSQNASEKLINTVDLNNVYSSIANLENQINLEKTRAMSAESNLASNINDFNQGDINAWLNNHPEKFVSIQDNSLTKNKLSADLKKEILNNYVTLEMFGATGNGTTDDTNAVIAAFQYCLTNKVNLYAFPKHYKTTDKCIINFNKPAGLMFNCNLDGFFDYLTFKNFGNIQNTFYIHINKVTNIKFIDVKEIHADINYVTNKFQLRAETTGCGYNKFTGIYWDSISLTRSGGWINSNKFYNMRTWSLSIVGDENRFYDLAIEATEERKGSISFGNEKNNKAYLNYVRTRGEHNKGKINISDYGTTRSTYHNIVEIMYPSSTPFDAISRFWTTPSGGTIVIPSLWAYQQTKTIFELNPENYNNNNNQITLSNNTMLLNINNNTNNTQTICSIFIDLSKGPSQLHIYLNSASKELQIKSTLRLLNPEDFTNETLDGQNENIFRFPGGQCSFKQNNNDPYYQIKAALIDSYNSTRIQFSKTNHWAKINLYLSAGQSVQFRTLQADLESYIPTQYFVTNKNFNK